MATSDKPCFTSKVFHFNVKNHVTSYFLISNGVWVRGVKDFKCNVNVLQFFSDGILSPKGISVVAVKVKSLLDGLRDCDPEFVGPVHIASVALLGQGNYPFALFQDVRYPPVECGLVSNVMATAYSATWMGWVSFKSLSGSQEVEPSCHWQQNFHPLVDFFVRRRPVEGSYVICWSRVKVVGVVLKSTNVSKRLY